MARMRCVTVVCHMKSSRQIREILLLGEWRVVLPASLLGFYMCCFNLFLTCHPPRHPTQTQTQTILPSWTSFVFNSIPLARSTLPIPLLSTDNSSQSTQPHRHSFKTNKMRTIFAFGAAALFALASAIQTGGKSSRLTRRHSSLR